MTSVVILYSELAGYTLACMKALQAVDGVQVHVCHWPVQAEAPFDLSGLPLEPRAGHNRASLTAWVEAAAPDLLIVSGWMDADYVHVARQWRRRIPVVLTMDNWWTGSWKQRLAALAAPFHVRRAFNRAWVPGAPQRTFAQKLGFAEEHIATGFYCADVPAFEQAWAHRAPERRLLYVGRYLPFKGVDELWSAFAELAPEFPEWTLDSIGTGDGWADRLLHDQIQHHGFLQPAALTPFLSRAACAVVPSHREPWGVVVHELAAAGLPLIVSDAVGAAEAFVAPDRNGYVHPAGDRPALKAALRAVMEKTEAERDAMGRVSRDLALQWTPEKWAARALEFLPS